MKVRNYRSLLSAAQVQAGIFRRRTQKALRAENWSAAANVHNIRIYWRHRVLGLSSSGIVRGRPRRKGFRGSLPQFRRQSQRRQAAIVQWGRALTGYQNQLEYFFSTRHYRAMNAWGARWWALVDREGL